MSEYIKLAEAPVFVFQSPTCGACSVELEHDGDGWECPCCGTIWVGDACDGEQGELYESWSGETLDGETVSEDAAYDAGNKHKREADKKRYAIWGWCEHGLPNGCIYSNCAGGKGVTAVESAGRVLAGKGGEARAND